MPEQPVELDDDLVEFLEDDLAGPPTGEVRCWKLLVVDVTVPNAPSPDPKSGNAKR